ncbi:hypothetical protein PPERSA_13178 [Pseudocohnilembus persalinus]|uniref:Tubulin-tyrosine ligase/Tubulin polyglutamylase n=1 Tax=Pseudocohnilembus persalinus TaxID=266149 RepID=A0A0V0QLC2_PSEPJ|nr:hypothetical protein PPERSA_13178 [Pseudocohnilembus persalinus]|eukprot:KRX02924.1 hypothetical protein PPERSA_13178 [Pseudocohnilembus persalinus]
MGKQEQEHKKKQTETAKIKNKQQKIEEGPKCPMRYIPKIAKFIVIPLILAYLFFSLQNKETTTKQQPISHGENYQIKYQYQSVIDKYKPFHPDIGVEFIETPKQLDKEISQYSDEQIQKVINQFHVWSNVTLEKHHYDTKYSFNWPHLGIKNNYTYCTSSDILKLKYPSIVFKNKYMYVDFSKNSLSRDLASAFGVDLTPYALEGQQKQIGNVRKYDLDPQISLIFSQKSRVHHFHPFTTCLFCLFQTSNHIPGKWDITGKDLVINNYKNYEKSNFKNPQQCKKTINFMPTSYRLFDKQECTQFFDYLKSQGYKNLIEKQGIAFIMKAGRDIHRGEGIEIMTDDVYQRYMHDYEQGKLCGKNKQTVQAQRYIANPMLYEGRKIEVRIYFLIASTDPLIIYSQNNAHLRMCSEIFDKHSLQKEVHVCNVALASKSGNQNFVIDFSLEGLRDYLLEKNHISNKNWVEDVIYPQIYQAIIHLVRSGQHRFLKDSRVNENFALDFLIDDESHLWFMENNPNPQIMRTSEKRVERHYQMFGDLFEIQFAQLRSRFKRLLNFTKNVVLPNFKDVEKNPEKYKEQFKKLNQNQIDPEFQIRQNNTYQKIYDENLQGAEKFMGNLPDDCLIN